MSMTDPIADMLTRIRNACGSKHRRVDMPVSKVKREIARILKENNFITDYRVIETVGTRPEFDFEPRDHVDLGRMLGAIDLERGAKVSGSRFYFLTGIGAQL